MDFGKAVNHLQSIQTNHVRLYLFDFFGQMVQLFYTNNLNHQFLVLVIKNEDFLVIKNIIFFKYKNYTNWNIDKSFGILNSKIFPILSHEYSYTLFYTKLMNVLENIEFYYFNELNIYSGINLINFYTEIHNQQVQQLQKNKKDFIEEVEPFLNDISNIAFDDEIELTSCEFSFGIGVKKFICFNELHIQSNAKCDNQKTCFLTPLLNQKQSNTESV